MKRFLEISSLALITMLLTTWFTPDATVLKGTVKDHFTKEPILFANVALYHSGKLMFGTETDFDGNYSFTNLNSGTYDVEVSYVGYKTKRVEGIVVKANSTTQLDVEIEEGIVTQEVVISSYKIPVIDFDISLSGSSVTAEEINSLPKKRIDGIAAQPAEVRTNQNVMDKASGSKGEGIRFIPQDALVMDQSLGTSTKKKWMKNNLCHEKRVKVDQSRDQYNSFEENAFINPQDEGLSTFSIDVDRASYSNVRRYLKNGTLPPKDAVRIEEMINYFDYNYAGPSGRDPFAIHTSLVECPWQEGHQLLHIGLQGERLNTDDLPPSNLVFLIDVSGSMNRPNKLPLLKASLKLLLTKLRKEDKVAIVTYAGRAGLALASTSMREKGKVLDVINGLGAGGSTAGAAGIHTAYEIALENFIEEGNNRVILATDGDFNVGVNSQKGLEDLIVEKRESGVFLSVLGFGMGNYQDGKMQVLANKGNGNHAYIDDKGEAQKILVKEFGGTLFTIAKDVKIQIEFNPAYVQEYRLIGYENRLLAKEDFNDDTKDAGELGAGHTVTAIYEIIPIGIPSRFSASVDPLKYQIVEKSTIKYTKNEELATIKFRYKETDGKQSKKIVQIVKPSITKKDDLSRNVQLSTQVAQFGQLLRDSKYKGSANYDQILKGLEGMDGEEVSDLRAMVLAASVSK